MALPIASFSILPSLGVLLAKVGSAKAQRQVNVKRPQAASSDNCGPARRIIG